jgi:hypothetical protein
MTTKPTSAATNDGSQPAKFPALFCREERGRADLAAIRTLHNVC